MKDDRYQYQCCAVKLYRWLRWKPLFALRAVWCLLRYPTIPDYFPYKRKWSKYAEHIWTMSMSHASMKMGHYYTVEEVLDEFRTTQP